MSGPGNGDLRITEIYRSIQGESTFAGLPCVFVRLTGCALRCVWCDSEYTFTGGEWMSLADVLGRVRSLASGRATGAREPASIAPPADKAGAAPPLGLVEFTGGEPLLQANVHTAIAALCDEGATVLVETGGDQDISPLDPRAIAIVDVKCPGSGMSERMDWSNLERLRPRDELKFVLDGRGDYEWARDLLRSGRVDPGRTVLFSCVFGRLDPADLAGWILEDGLPARLQLQLHKILWDPAERGR